MRNAIVLIGVVCCAAAAAAQTPKSPQKPGKWQMKMEMEMPGMPMKMPPITTEVCITEADLADPQKAVPQSDPKSQCKVGEYKIKDNTVSWTIDCPKQKTTGSGEITYSGDSFTGSMTMKMDDREMKTKYSGKWLSTCTK
jgi:uncharacterized protein DUF3617